jgi:hypothetical protein
MSAVVRDRSVTRRVTWPPAKSDLETYPAKPEIAGYSLPVTSPALFSNPTLAVLRCAESGEAIELPRLLRAVIGRRMLGKEQLVQLDLSPHGAYEMGVSRLHAVLYRKPGALFLQDLESLNGTFVNGRRLAPGQLQPLCMGDELLFARLRCYVEIN